MTTYYAYGFDLGYGQFNEIGGAADLATAVLEASRKLGHLDDVLFIRVERYEDGHEYRHQLTV